MNSNKKLIVLFGTMIAQIGLGTLYTWSLFNKPLASMHGFGIEQVVLSFSITSFSLAIGTLFAGKLQDTFGIKGVVCGCGVLLGIGLIAAPRFNQLWQLYISAGFLVGFVDGIAYILTLSNCIKWFPNKKGLIAGISVGCYGLGSFIFKYINSALLSSSGVVKTFMYWGIMAFALIFIGGLLIKEAPHVSENNEISKTEKLIHKQYTRSELFKSPQAYLLFISFFASCFSGLFLIGTAKNIGVLFAGLTPAQAGNSIAYIAIFNTLGRILLGWLSDKFNRTKVSAFAFFLIFFAVSIILFVEITPLLFTVAIACIAFAFGGNLTVFPSIVADYFGTENHNKNYGIIYQGFGVGGILGGLIAEIMGGFKPTFWVMLFVSFVALVIMLLLQPPTKRLKIKEITK
ncbi:MAG: L-lactate MFS transporter [Sarcina sp.]